MRKAATYSIAPGPPPFARLCELEPALSVLARDAASCRRRKPVMEIWYRDFKPRLEQLVGWGAKNPQLRAEECYDIAYETILAILSAPRKL